MPETIDYFEYRIMAGDTLSLIIAKMFGVSYSNPKYRDVMTYLLALNPQITNTNRIRAGDILRIGILPPMSKPVLETSLTRLPPPLPKPRPKDCQFSIARVPRHDLDNYNALSWMAQNANYLTIPGGTALGAQSNLLSPANIGLIESVSDSYAAFKADKITRGQYNYARKKSLDLLRKNIGPMESFLFGKKTPHEVVRIARHGGVPKTAHIEKQANKLRRIAALGKSGGYVLTGVGIAASCKQIADTDDNVEKNEIFVETLTSTAIGTISGSIIGLFLVSSPLGWGAAIVLATGSAAMSYGAGKIARIAYTTNGSTIDLVSGLGVNSICK